jgi:hypothetical protein
MIPNLGWSTKLFESKLLKLRHDLVEDRLRYEPNLDNDEKRQRQIALLQRYEQEYLYYDNQYLELLKNELNDEIAERHFNHLQVSGFSSRTS